MRKGNEASTDSTLLLATTPAAATGPKEASLHPAGRATASGPRPSRKAEGGRGRAHELGPRFPWLLSPSFASIYTGNLGSTGIRELTVLLSLACL